MDLWLSAPIYHLRDLVGNVSNLFACGNNAHVYELVKKIDESKQGERALAEYYLELRALLARD